MILELKMLDKNKQEEFEKEKNCTPSFARLLKARQFFVQNVEKSLQIMAIIYIAVIQAASLTIR